MLLHTLEETVSQYLFVVAFAPLFAGILANLKARVESRKGPSILQPYYDLAKLIRKETVFPQSSGNIFRYSPYLLFGIYSLIALIIPVLIPEPVFFTASADFLGGAILFSLAAFVKILSAMDSGNSYSVMGVSRAMSFNFLSEGTLITVFFAVSLMTGTNNPYVTNHFLTANTISIVALDHVFSTLAFAMLFLYETGKIPVESSGLMELGMIEEGLVYEYSGKLLAISKWSSYMKQCLLGSVLLNVFLVPWGLYSTGYAFLIDFPVMLAKWILLILVVVTVETTLAKLRLFRIMDYLAVAFTFSILFLIFSEVIL
ncbi:MAG: respiratory chain complex I subunit 1 family protein [Thermoplasmataceae archaeon]